MYKPLHHATPSSTNSASRRSLRQEAKRLRASTGESELPSLTLLRLSNPLFFKAELCAMLPPSDLLTLTRVNREHREFFSRCVGPGEEEEVVAFHLQWCSRVAEQERMTYLSRFDRSHLDYTPVRLWVMQHRLSRGRKLPRTCVFAREGKRAFCSSFTCSHSRDAHTATTSGARWWRGWRRVTICQPWRARGHCTFSRERSCRPLSPPRSTSARAADGGRRQSTSSPSRTSAGDA